MGYFYGVCVVYMRMPPLAVNAMLASGVCVFDFAKSIELISG